MGSAGVTLISIGAPRDADAEADSFDWSPAIELQKA